MNKQRPFWAAQTLADLERDEGFREYAYPDPLSALFRQHRKERWGFEPADIIAMRIQKATGKSVDFSTGAPWTVGFGFTRGVTYRTRISIDAARHKLEDEMLAHLHVLDKVLPKWQEMPDVVKTVLANLAFNLGTRFWQFKNTIKLLNAGNFPAAADNLQASLWYKQVGGRAVRLVKRLRTGKIEPENLIN